MILREFIALFGIKTDEKSFQDADKKIQNFSNGLTNALKAVGVAYAASRVARFVKDQIDVADHLKDTAVALGINVEQLQRLGYASEQSGLRQEEFQASLSRMNLIIGQAAKGSKSAREALKGIDWNAAASGAIDGSEAFLQIADSISKIENPTIRASKAREIFGRGFAPLLPLLSEGRAGVEKLAKEFDRTGAGFTKEQVAQADATNDAFNEFKKTLLGLSRPLVDFFLKDGGKLLRTMSAWLQGMQDIIKHSNLVKTVLLGLTAVVLYFNSAWLAGVAIFTAVTLILEDLFTLFNGGQSAIGKMVDSIAGVGASSKIIEEVKAAWNGFVDAFKNSGLIEIAKGIAKGAFFLFSTAIIGLVKLASWLLKGLTWVLNLLSDFGASLGGLQAVKDILGSIGKAVDNVIMFFDRWFKRIGDVIDSLKEAYAWVQKINPFSSKEPSQKARKNPVGILAPTAPLSSPLLPVSPFSGSSNATLPSITPNILNTAPSKSSINYTDAAQLNITVNAGATSDAREIARIAGQEVRKALNDNNSETLNTILRVARPVGAL